MTLDTVSLKKQDFIGDFFPSTNENINFKNQKLNIKYNNKKLSLSGYGKIKVDDENELNQLINADSYVELCPEH